MNKKICFAVMAATILLGCERNAADLAEVQKEKVFLEVELLSDETKVSGEGGNEEMKISSYQVLVYDMSSRMLEAYENPDPSSSSVTLHCTTGPKEVVVLANAPDVRSIVSYDAFLKTKSLLEDNGIGNLVMEGSASPDLTAAGGTVAINIRRIVAKVVLDSITTDFEIDAYDDMDFILKDVYLTNVAADKSYLAEDADPSKWYNQIVRTSDNAVDGLLYDKIGDVNLKETKKYSVKHHFYCYPNPHTEDTFSPDVWSPRPTRLVVEAMLGNTLYYYPVSLPELKQNTRYHVSLNIVRPGAVSPEQDMDKYAASFKIVVENWEGSENVSETI